MTTIEVTEEHVRVRSSKREQSVQNMFQYGVSSTSK